MRTKIFAEVNMFTITHTRLRPASVERKDAFLSYNPIDILINSFHSNLVYSSWKCIVWQ